MGLLTVTGYCVLVSEVVGGYRYLCVLASVTVLRCCIVLHPGFSVDPSASPYILKTFCDRSKLFICSQPIYLAFHTALHIQSHTMRLQVSYRWMEIESGYYIQGFCSLSFPTTSTGPQAPTRSRNYATTKRGYIKFLAHPAPSSQDLLHDKKTHTINNRQTK